MCSRPRARLSSVPLRELDVRWVGRAVLRHSDSDVAVHAHRLHRGLEEVALEPEQPRALLALVEHEVAEIREPLCHTAVVDPQYEQEVVVPGHHLEHHMRRGLQADGHCRALPAAEEEVDSGRHWYGESGRRALWSVEQLDVLDSHTGRVGHRAVRGRPQSHGSWKVVLSRTCRIVAKIF